LPQTESTKDTPQNVGRRLRELENVAVVEVRFVKGHADGLKDCPLTWNAAQCSPLNSVRAALTVPEYEFLAKQCEELAQRARTPQEAAELRTRADTWRRLATARNVGGRPEQQFQSEAHRRKRRSL
jgi:hypothetical protein